MRELVGAFILVQKSHSVDVRDYMDRFLDEQESPVPVDRVSLAATVSAADCEQVTSQQQVSTDDNKSSSEVHADGKPITPREGEGDAKPPIPNGESLTVANTSRILPLPSSDGNVPLTAGESVACSKTDDVKIESCSDTDAVLLHADAAAAASQYSPDRLTNVTHGSSAETSTSSVVPPCPVAHDVMPGGSRTEQMETEEIYAISSESAVVTAVSEEQDKPSSDVCGVVLEPSETAASSSSSATTVPEFDQQCLDDDNPVSPDSHDACDTASQLQSVGLDTDAQLSASTVPQESHTTVPGSAMAAATDVDEVKPGDVELLLAAVDSATSVVGSLYSNVDPMTAALEFSSSATGVSAELLSTKTDAADSCTNSSVQSSSQATNGQPSKSTSLPHSSSSLSDSGGSTSVSHLAPNHSDASVTKQDDGSVACKSDSVSTPHVIHDAGEDMKQQLVKPSVAITPTSTGDLLSTSRAVLLPDESDSGSRAHIVHDQVEAISASEENSAAELSNLTDNANCPKQSELLSLNSNQITESCLHPKNISVLGPDASTAPTDGTDVKTNSDDNRFCLSSGELTQPDRLGDGECCSLDNSEQSDSADSISLLTVPSDADYTSSAS